MDQQKSIRMALRIAKADGGPVTAPPDRKLNAQGLYSAAAEAARALPQQKGTPQQMLASLKGVKPDELKWSGAQEKFAGQPSVTKDELAQHFENNLPQIQEHSGNAKFQRYSMTPQNTYGGQRAVKGSYGTNYREKLLTLPSKPASIPSFEEWHAKTHVGDIPTQDQVDNALPELRPHLQAMLRIAHRQYEQQKNVLTNSNNFQSTHYQEPNILAHLRMSDWQTPAPASQQPRYPNPPKPDTTAGLSVRNAPNGIKNVPAWSTRTPGLMVHREEGGKSGEYTLTHAPSGLALKRKIPYYHAQDLASRLGHITDWTEPDAENLKAHFKVNPDSEKRRVAEFEREPYMPEKVMPKSRKPARAPEKNLLLDELQSDWGQKAKQEGGTGIYNQPGATGVPDAPYIDSTQKWTDLGLKRALHEAAHGGYDRLLWTPGEKHAARYNLSKQVDHIQYLPEHNHLRAFKAGHMLIGRDSVSPNELPGIIGKEVANKLLEAPIGTTRDGTKYHELRGSEMDVGGEGMKGFYNNIVPKRLLALAKEHDPDAKLEHYVDPHKGSAINGFPSLPITEKMRQSIKTRGFKAYQRGGSVPMPDPAKSIRKALRIAGTHA